MIGNVANFIEEMAQNGYGFVRFEDNFRLRDELIGQPIFRGLIGPMYNGEGCVRYENQAAYNAMCN